MTVGLAGGNSATFERPADATAIGGFRLAFDSHCSDKRPHKPISVSSGLNRPAVLESDKPPVLTLVRRTDGRVRFFVCEDLQYAGKGIAEYGDGSVILCTDDYTIYDDI